MLTINGFQITVSRGDTGSVTLNFSGDAPADGVTAVVTLKQKVEAAAPVWEKRLTILGGGVTFELTRQDTDHAPGVYFWDVRLVNGDSVLTPLTPQPFRILEVVGCA